MADTVTRSSPREALRQRARRMCVPLGVHFELTKRCNLGCYHCYVVHDGDELPTERWLGLVDEVAAAGCLSVTLTGGEVCLREDWLEIARAVRRARMVVSVFTNGTLLDDPDMDALASLVPAVVSMSLYAADAAGHDAVTLVPGSFDRTIRSLEGLRERGVRCRVSTVLMQDTFEDYPAVKRLADELGCSFSFDYTVSPREDGDPSPTGHRMNEAQLRALVAGDDSPLEAVDGQSPEGDGRIGRGRSSSCGAARSRGWIGADGSLLPCMGLPPIGSVRQRSFLDVWRSETASHVREQLQRPEGDCVECSLAHWCTAWCPRLALYEDGNMSGHAGRACHIAEITRQHWETEHARSA